MATPHYRTVWISDTHLGSRGCQAVELAEFLARIRCRKLYLVGDIIDFWRLRSRPFWPASHSQVVQSILALVDDGVEIIYIPGNHDEAARDFIGVDLGGIRIRKDDLHTTADGRTLLVTHGDQFDLIVKHSRLTALLGAAAYEWLIFFNRRYNRLRERLNMGRSSFSQTIKLKVKSACMFISAFEETLIGAARARALDGVVCGHIHQPEIRRSDSLEYHNCGDWIEHCTALVEHGSGEIELIHFDHRESQRPLMVERYRGRTLLKPQSAAVVLTGEPDGREPAVA